MGLNLAPLKCLGFRSPAEAFLNDLGEPLTIRFNTRVESPSLIRRFDPALDVVKRAERRVLQKLKCCEKVRMARKRTLQ